MPPKIIFTKEQIIDSAFEIFKKEGIESISVRKLASKLGSSTAPIYTSFNNIQDIKKQLMEKSLILLLSYTEKEYTKGIFLNIGVGMLEFARDYKIVYRTLFINTNEYQYILKEFNEINVQQMKKEKRLDIFGETELRSILETMYVFTHGLASFLCSGMLEDDSKEYFIRMLNEVGGAIMAAYAYKRGSFEEFMNSSEERGCQDEKNYSDKWDSR